MPIKPKAPGPMARKGPGPQRQAPGARPGPGAGGPRKGPAAKPVKSIQDLAPIQEPYKRPELVQALSEVTGVARKNVAGVLDQLVGIIGQHLAKGGPGSFTLPGLFKVVTVEQPAREAQTGVPNPFKPGETMDVAARPAGTGVRVQPLKRLREMVR